MDLLFNISEDKTPFRLRVIIQDQNENRYIMVYVENRTGAILDRLKCLGYRAKTELLGMIAEMGTKHNLKEIFFSSGIILRLPYLEVYPEGMKRGIWN